MGRFSNIEDVVYPVIILCSRYAGYIPSRSSVERKGAEVTGPHSPSRNLVRAQPARSELSNLRLSSQ